MSTPWSTDYEVEGENVHVTIRWSPWGSMTKWVIGRIVPSEAGIIQIWVKQQRRLELLHTESNYYSGLRNRLIEIVDELAPAGKTVRDIIGRREAWFRYSILNSRNQLQILEKWFSHCQYLQDSEKREIRVKEIETFKKFPLPPPDIQIHERRNLDVKGFGPPLPRQSHLKSAKTSSK